MPVYRIYLSPSNQVHNVGVDGYNEATEMHKLAERIKYHLNLSPVFLVKISDIKLSLDEVCQDSDNYHADFHFAMHTDAGPVDAKGTTGFIYGAGGKGEKFAKILYDKIAPLSPGKDRGIVVRPGLCELRKTKAPSLLIENFFHTSPEEVKHYRDNFEEYAKQTALAFYEFFDVPYPVSPPAPVKEHWAEVYYKKLTEQYKIPISDRRFDDKITRGEVMAILCKMLDGNADVDSLCKKITDKLKLSGVY